MSKSVLTKLLRLQVGKVTTPDHGLTLRSSQGILASAKVRILDWRSGLIPEQTGGAVVTFAKIPVEALSPQALDGLIEEFVTREGTDYGAEERTLDDKKDAVRRQLDSGDVAIVFDPETQTSNIILKDELRKRDPTQSR